MHWNVGRVKITKIVELETVGSTRFILPLATHEEIQKLPWLIPHFATDEGRLKMSDMNGGPNPRLPAPSKAIFFIEPTFLLHAELYEIIRSR